MSYAYILSNEPDHVDFTITVGAANVANVAVQLKHGKNATAGVQIAGVHLADDPTTKAVTATAASGTVTTTTGAVAATVEAKKQLAVASTNTGGFTIAITDTAKTPFYVVVTLANGTQFVSPQLANSYGSA